MATASISARMGICILEYFPLLKDSSQIIFHCNGHYLPRWGWKWWQQIDGKQTSRSYPIVTTDSVGAQQKTCFPWSLTNFVSQTTTSHHLVEFKQVLESLGGTARQILRPFYIYPTSLGSPKNRPGIKPQSPAVTRQEWERWQEGECGRGWPHLVVSLM